MLQVIFDEAHNIESTCEGASSFELTALEVAGMLSELQKVRCISNFAAMLFLKRLSATSFPFSFHFFLFLFTARTQAWR
jgi:Rad3-related DNA helicase